jgi:predicted cytidylate kinase
MGYTLRMAIITIGGNIGAGKTTLAGKLALALGYEELRMGHIFRMMAAEQGRSIEEFYAALAGDAALERSVDERQATMMHESDDLVVSGRMSWFLAKNSQFDVFNIFLKVDPRIGAERTAKREEHAGHTIEELMQINKAREATELERYRALYGIQNFHDTAHYDLTLDTSHITEDAVLQKVIEKIGEEIDLS